jgi:hypothetical protein
LVCNWGGAIGGGVAVLAKRACKPQSPFADCKALELALTFLEALRMPPEGTTRSAVKALMVEVPVAEAAQVKVADGGQKDDPVHVWC